MAVLRFTVVLGLCLLALANAQQCDQQIDDFHKCLSDSAKNQFKGRQGSGPGGKPNFAELKTKMDACFTSNGCDAPQMPERQPGGGASGAKGQGGPAGGRAGRVGGAGGGNNADNRKCFESVINKTKDYMNTCIKKADPTFNPSKASGGEHGHGGPGGHGGFGGDHKQGGHGFGGQGGPGGAQGGKQYLLKACKDNQANADKVNACIAGVFPHQQKPDTAQMKQAFDDHCNAKKTCQAKLGNCQAVLETRRKAMCTCGEETRAKHQEFQQQEPACANLPQRPGQGPAANGQGKKQPRDCNAQPQDPCTQGFEATMQQAQSHRGQHA